MHSFVLSFFQQCVDPSVVSFHCPQRSKMSVHCCNKPWYTCNCFQEEHPIQPVFLCQNIFLPREHLFVSTHVIETESQRLNEGISKFISDICRVKMCDIDLFNFLLCPNRVRHCPFSCFKYLLLEFSFLTFFLRCQLERASKVHPRHL